MDLAVIQVYLECLDGLVQEEFKVREDRVVFRVSREQWDSRASLVHLAVQASPAMSVTRELLVYKASRVSGDLMVSRVIAGRLEIPAHREVLVRMAQLVNVDHGAQMDCRGQWDFLDLLDSPDLRETLDSVDSQGHAEILELLVHKVLLDSLVCQGHRDLMDHLDKSEKLVRQEAEDSMDCQALLALQVFR